MQRVRFGQFVVAALFVATIFLGTSNARAERPAIPALLPHDTLVLVSIPNAKQLAEKFQDTAMGRLANDPEIKPLVSHLYGSASEAYAAVEEQVGVPLEELLNLPQGEIALAIVAPEKGRPSAVALFDGGENPETARELIERGFKAMEADGAKKTSEKVGDVSLTIFQLTDNPDPLVYFEKDGAFVACTNLEVARLLLAIWNGEQTTTLADNPQFATIMKRSRGTKDEPAQFLWYADPIKFARASTRDSFSATAGLAVLPALGLDGLQAIGGGFVLATEDFDSIAYLHVLLDNPRAGVLKMLAVESGPAKPERWVPADAASYVTLHWDTEKTYQELSVLFDSFRGEEAWSKMVEKNVNEPTGVDLKTDILMALDGRVTYVSQFERPIAVNSEARLVAFKLKDAALFQQTLDKLNAKFPGRMERKPYGGGEYYVLVPTEEQLARRERQAERRNTPREDGTPRGTRIETRPFEPGCAIVGDYFMIVNQTSFLETAIRTKSSAAESLADQLDFKLIASKVKRMAGGNKPAVLTFNRPEEAMRMLYDLATAENTRTVLTEQSERSGFFRSLNGALQTNPLPPFSVIQKYLAPGGGMLVDDETGMHYTGFTLRRE